MRSLAHLPVTKTTCVVTKSCHELRAPMMILASNHDGGSEIGKKNKGKHGSSSHLDFWQSLDDKVCSTETGTLASRSVVRYCLIPCYPTLAQTDKGKPKRDGEREEREEKEREGGRKREGDARRVGWKPSPPLARTDSWVEPLFH